MAESAFKEEVAEEKSMAEMIRETIDSLPSYFNFQTSADDILPPVVNEEEAVEQIETKDPYLVVYYPALDMQMSGEPRYRAFVDLESAKPFFNRLLNNGMYQAALYDGTLTRIE